MRLANFKKKTHTSTSGPLLRGCLLARNLFLELLIILTLLLVLLEDL
jgi:hypothetical protein